MHSVNILGFLGSGVSADVFRLIDGRILKLFRSDVEPGLPAREIDGVTRAHAEGLTVAKAVAIRSFEQRTGIIFEDLQGKPLIGRYPGLNIGRLRSALRALAQCHARIHDCDASGLAHHQHIIVRVRIEGGSADPELKALALNSLETLPRGDRLCHGDFHPGNALTTSQGIAPIDWANGCAGDPAGDVARTEMLLRFGQYGPLLRRIPALRYARHLAADYYLREYRRASGMALERIAAWRLPVLISGLAQSSRLHRESLLAEIRCSLLRR